MKRPRGGRDPIVGTIADLFRRDVDREQESPDTYILTDEDGATRMQIGQQDDGSWGYVIYDSTGQIAYRQTAT